jgi:hypothetical protein
MATIDIRYADKRTVERYIKAGKIDEKEFEKHVKALPDLADKAQPVAVVMDEFFDDQVEIPEGE